MNMVNISLVPSHTPSISIIIKKWLTNTEQRDKHSYFFSLAMHRNRQTDRQTDRDTQTKMQTHTITNKQI